MPGGRTRRWLLLLAGLAALGGCKSLASMKQKAAENTRAFFHKSYDDPRALDKYAEAEQLMTEGKFDKARVMLHELAGNNHNPKDLTEKARFQEAECYRLARKYPDAVDTYHKMLMDHPSGVYRDQACEEIFKIADYWLDDTRSEIEAMRDGKSTTLMKLKRQFHFDRTKPGTDIEGRAMQALDHISTDGVGSPNVDKALFWSGYVKFVRGNFEEADHYFSMIHQYHQDSPLRPIATEYAIMCKNNATGGSPYDGQKAAEALQLVHHAESSMPEFRSEDKNEFLTRQKFAIRAQQADKDFRMAEYYEQTKHPGSAYFYYEIVRRRYPGTKYAEMASERMKALNEMNDRGELKAASGDVFADMKKTWRRWTKPETETAPPAEASP